VCAFPPGCACPSSLAAAFPQPFTRAQGCICCRQWWLYSKKTLIQKKRAPFACLCEILAPFVLVLLFAYLHTLVSLAVVGPWVGAASLGCPSLSVPDTVSPQPLW
jgi:hypothetical protein